MKPSRHLSENIEQTFHAFSQNGQLFHVNLCLLFESDEEVSLRLEEYVRYVFVYTIFLQLYVGFNEATFVSQMVRVIFEKAT